MVTQPIGPEYPIIALSGTIHFLRPIIGWELATDYELRSISPKVEPFIRMASLDERGPAFIVVPPGFLFSDYVIEIPEQDCDELGLRSEEDVLVLGIVRRKGVSIPTVNLMAPVIVNERLFVASQVVLDKSGYGVAVPINAPSAKDA